ncbi:MAG: 3-octaprenyl-4-hydroxybenzoate carboxy-lyase UbiX [Fusobacteria bacterium]|nr:MAG: 3-octaprenyl-4-hydroxybenzoate carboxy-lyase UbiX [Fusobacteriota bacterium]KAF0228746.1 MAG: 3-octaprenyl-4-hydroxybenzoate carboxy-lyase [Fusobacteriota bacterium]
MGKYIIGITGASGAIYGMRLIEECLKAGHEIFLTITKSGRIVIKEELNMDLDLNVEMIEDRLLDYFKVSKDVFTYYDIDHISSAIASGSFRTDGMIIAPCSMATVSAIAHGSSTNLLERAADVILKEGKPMILIPRETPLSAIHLENLLKLARLGVKIIPPMPSFYTHPKTIDDIVNNTVGRILDQLNIEHNLCKRWS